MRVALLAFAAGCSAELVDEPPPPPPPLVDLEIVELAATSTSVEICRTTEIRWVVRGAELVNVSMEGATLVSTRTALVGSVESRPVCDDATVTLSAKNGEREVSRSLALSPAWSTPLIPAFDIPPDPFVGDEVTLSWRTGGARWVRLEQNGALIADLEVTDDSLREERLKPGTPGGVRATITSTETSFVLTASNPSFSHSRRLVVVGHGPRFDLFRLSPPGGVERRAVAIQWDALGAVTVEASVDGVPLPGFTSETSGSFSVDLSPGSRVSLTAFGIAGTATSTEAIFEAPALELEPNDTQASAAPAGHVTLASIAAPDDVDVYRLWLPEYPRFTLIYAASPDGGACPSFTPRVRVLGQAGATFAEGVNECGFVDNLAMLPGGLYYLEVSSASAQTGDYLLIVTINR